MKITELRKKLRSLISGDVLWDEEIINCYSVDSSSYLIKPKVVVFPKNKEDVIKIVKFATKNKISITSRGGATGLVGSAIGNGIIIDFRNLKKISLEEDYVIVESGVSKGKLDVELQKKKKFLGPNPSVGPYCTVGGMIATNASGSRSLKYGAMIDNILEIEFIDGSGNLVTFPSKSVLAGKILKIALNTNKEKFPNVSKNSCGYRLDSVSSITDVQKILAGSEGTLGIIISAKLRIYNQPKSRNLMVFGYELIKDAMRDCKKIIRIKPSALEFVDDKTLKNIDYHIPKTIKCLLFIEIDEKIQRGKYLKNNLNGKLLKSTFEEKEIKKWWKYRDSSLSYSLKNILKAEKAPHIIEDAAVPIKNLNKLISLISNINKKFNSRSIIYGHAGNGNLHVRLITKEKNKKIIKEIAEKYFHYVNRLGGTITAEHGDGLARTEFIKQQYGNQTYLEFKRLKKLLDPHGILNPDKIISEKSQIVENLILS